MFLNCLLNALRLDADILLRDGAAVVLQKALYKNDVVIVVPVNLCGIPFPEGVGGDSRKSKKLAHGGQVLLACAYADRKNQVIGANGIAKAKVLDVLSDDERYGEDSLLSGLLLDDGEMVAATVVDDIAETELHDVADPKPQVRFQNQRGCNPFIRPEKRRPFLHGGDDCLILLCSESNCLLVHGILR